MSNFDINISGGASIRLLTAGKYCDKDIVITAEDPGEGGVQLPPIEEENAATASDIVAGKQAIDADGNVVEGVVEECTGSWAPPSIGLNLEPPGKATGYRAGLGTIPPTVTVKMDAPNDILIREGTSIVTTVDARDFGSALAENVAKGKTFTSKYGLKVEGTGDFVTLDTLQYPADASDILKGMQAYDDEGNLITGEAAFVIVQEINNPATPGEIILGKEALDKDGNKIVGTYEPYELPTLTTPAEESDVVAGKEFINAAGEKNVGTVPEYADGDFWYNRNTVEFVEEDGVAYLVAVPEENALIRPNSVVFSEIPVGWMGDATPADVAAGKIFSSRAGFRQVGTAQMGGGLETVNVTFTIYGPGTIYYMGANGVATLTSPYEQTVAVVKDSPVTVVHDDSTYLLNRGGSGHTVHYSTGGNMYGHSCEILSFYEDGMVIFEQV